MVDFIIISCGRNCETYVERHMRSINDQSYQNFKHIIVNDASDDQTSYKFRDHRGPNDIIIDNVKRCYWVENALNYLEPNIITGDEVVVIVDLDDWLMDEYVLGWVAKEYEQHKDCWMTYSRMFYHKAQRSSHWIPPYTIQNYLERNFRTSMWSFTHLRTFKGFLWRHLVPDDLKGPDGKWTKYSWDRAVLYPMLEMSSQGHVRFIPDVLYGYNDENSQQVEQTHRAEQEAAARFFSSKPKYPVLVR